ncbi:MULTISPECIES: hypothetical protein [Variovorax]|jgi:hypothetical protein|uniref:hypothetical protein n=1 Tax=Variovorax TaxID=34072 RepID=UPI00086EDF3E|nr:MULTISPECIES: hypothetical protein [Variovorax]MBN8755194.1 hypothetical protein [Variovorax sp.]ODU16045.1 MAG: hypothetical protein ABS94_16160 [Variovorax sp. SCN 67-85]ODV22295.1 MAG: hypothetical protein ABT25_21340 [Variovorax sp. SCN 67-20]OJZ14243.1 MAG: hypothetical protein BGP22_06000 [Variovorax sp. 67-131]UKI08777.1 hypothetical protein L3V85_02675 [Variovorax paradoxus]
MEDTTPDWFVAKALMALANRRAEAAQAETAAPATAPDAQVREADPFATRLWNLLRIRRALTADEAAALLLADAEADEDIAQGRRQAGALMLSWSRQCPQAVRMDARRVDGLKRYALLRDIGATPPAPRGEAR